VVEIELIGDGPIAAGAAQDGLVGIQVEIVPAWIRHAVSDVRAWLLVNVGAVVEMRVAVDTDRSGAETAVGDPWQIDYAVPIDLGELHRQTGPPPPVSTAHFGRCDPASEA
jgi:hypothetical protein